MLIQPSEWKYGYDLSKQTGLQSGTLYPLLIRLADQGLLETAWKPSEIAGRPPRHVYRLTAEGITAARELTAARRHRAPTRTLSKAASPT